MEMKARSAPVIICDTESVVCRHWARHQTKALEERDGCVCVRGGGV